MFEKQKAQSFDFSKLCALQTKLSWEVEELGSHVADFSTS